MAQEIKMPNLGSDMEEGILLNWTKQVGEAINEGDVIAEIETDKATVEVPATATGTIIKLIGEPGETLKVGSVIGYVGAQGENAPANGGSTNGGAPAPASKPAPTQASVAAAAEQQPAAAPASTEASQAEAAEGDDGNYPDGVKASPVARNIAAERGIDLKLVLGSGPGGRIVKADVERYEPSAAPAAVAAPSKPSAISAPSYGTLPSGEDVEIIDTPKMRSRIAARMIDSKQQVPHFYVTTEIDVEALLNLRKQINAELDDAHKVTVNDLIVKAAALTLRDFPNLNSHFYGDKVARYKRINIGIAVALPQGGLINVVAKDADNVSLGTMAAKNKEMIAAVREGKVRPDDISGSTFTVSNLGAYDVEHFIAIINPPEAGILAVGSAQKVPVVKEDGTLGIGNRMKVTISVDHRVSDGAEGAQYMQRFKALMENPLQLLL
ncbi:MAG: 2-oxo acid dehydrogenase subunit E2 [Anaerolineae bacterium]|nr:2-oxo acid dehydrogenase subunit E2 [Anaerolineae bacterium]